MTINKFASGGTHVLADFHGIDVELLKNRSKLISHIKEAIKVSGSELIDLNYHQFEPHGTTICAILSESSLDFHSWDENSFCSISIFVCGQADPLKGIEYLKSVFKPEHADVIKIKRGEKGNMSVEVINLNE